MPQDKTFPWVKAHPVFWVLLAAAAIVRLDGLFNFALDWDESNILALANLPFFKIIPMTLKWELHPPGVHLLLHLWTLLFGATDASVRMFAWLFGMLGLVGTYLLAGKISGSRKIAALTMLLSIASPMLWRYSQVASMYVVEYAAVMFSWYFLLCSLQSEKLAKEKTFWAYLASTLVMLWAHSLGPVVLVFQGVYLAVIRKTLPAKTLITFLIAGVVLLIPNLYHIWLKLQPWSLANAPEQHDIHAQAPLWFFALSPVNLLLLGYDVRDIAQMPAPLTLLIYAVVVYALLAFGFRTAKRENGNDHQLLLCIGIYPLLSLYAGSALFGLAVFHLRTLLYTLVVFHLLISRAIVSQWESHKKVLAVVFVALFIGLQFFSPHRRPPQEDPWRYLANEIHHGWQPGDGVVIYPGWNHIGLMRYLDPQNFGFTAQELAYDPRQENYFHMFHGVSDRYFLVSGDDVLQRPEVRAGFKAFQHDHPRVWIVGHSPALMEQLDCDTRFMVLLGNTFTPATCHGPVQEAKTTD